MKVDIKIEFAHNDQPHAVSMSVETDNTREYTTGLMEKLKQNAGELVTQLKLPKDKSLLSKNTEIEK